MTKKRNLEESHQSVYALNCEKKIDVTHASSSTSVPIAVNDNNEKQFKSWTIIQMLDEYREENEKKKQKFCPRVGPKASKVFIHFLKARQCEKNVREEFRNGRGLAL